MKSLGAWKLRIFDGPGTFQSKGNSREGDGKPYNCITHDPYVRQIMRGSNCSVTIPPPPGRPGVKALEGCDAPGAEQRKMQ